MNYNRNEYYIIPENFKRGRYIFNRYRPIDLAILIGGCSIGTLIIILSLMTGLKIKNLIFTIIGMSIGAIILFAGLILTLNVSYYHNLLGKFTCLIRYKRRNKKFVYKGVDYLTYEQKRK